MIKQIFYALKVSVLALILSFGISYVYAAWTAPMVTPPGGNTDAPLNTSATAQTKVGDLTVGKVTAPSHCIGTSCITSWPSGGDNLGNHTATQSLNLGLNNIVAAGADSIYGSLSIQGAKNGYSGINFKDATGATNHGTLMMSPNWSGFFNAADDNWKMIVGDTTPTGYGNVYASDYYSTAAGKWMSQMQSSGIPTLSAVRIYNTTGDGVWVKPANITSIIVEVYGAGGGGSTGYACSGWWGPGGGGGSGGHSMKKYSASDLGGYSALSYTVGSGGAGGSGWGVSGASGGASKFWPQGSFWGVWANGGTGGSGVACVSGIGGGAGALAGYGGEYNLAGNDGGNNSNAGNGLGASSPIITTGGASFGYPLASAAATIATLTPALYGRGGDGSAPGTAPAGSHGAIIVYEYTN